MSTDAKKLKGMKVIGTHSGTFHCDEVLACFLLRRLPEYADAEILRSRDPAKLATCDIVVDVGGEYKPENHRYDHHQRSFDDCMNSLDQKYSWKTKLSSAGLIYFHFGKRIIADMISRDTSDNITGIIYDKVYENFVEEVDAVDNGIDVCEGEPRYAITTTISRRVGNLNPSWNEKDVDVQKRFDAAMELVGSEFLDRVSYYKNAWLPARSLVEAALKNRYEVDAGGQIIVLDQTGCPWKDHLLALEEEHHIHSQILFVLYQDDGSNWRVQCVPKGLNTFDNRLSLHEDWRGVRDDKLSEVSGIPQCIFVHTSGFIGGNRTFHGALEMARRTISAQN